MYPAAFVETDLRTVPFVDKWLYDNARASCHAKSEKDNDRIDVCCDPESGRCGVAESSLAPRNSRRALPRGQQPQLVPASFHIPSLPLHPVPISWAAASGAYVENIRFEKQSRIAYVRIVNTSTKDISGLNSMLAAGLQS
jgi:hypothetical protein